MRGRFRSFAGEFHIADVPEESWVEVTISAESLDTVNDAANESLKSDRFLDVEKYPELHFRSTDVQHLEADRWLVKGDLTIKGITRPITLDSTFAGAVPAPEGYGPSWVSRPTASLTDATTVWTSTSRSRRGDG